MDAKQVKRTKHSEVKNYPIYTSPGSVILLGAEGIPVDKHAWALQVEFQFDEQQVDAYQDAKKYSVLVSSYKNNAIMTRLCGDPSRPGIQILFMKKQAFEDAPTLLQKCQEYEKEQPREREQPIGKHAKDKAWLDKYPRGEGRFQVTPVIPMEQLRWYRLEIQGCAHHSVTTPGISDDNSYELHVRLDPLVKGESVDEWYIEGLKVLDYDESHDCVLDYDESHDPEQPWWREKDVHEYKGGPDERKKRKLVQPWFYTQVCTVLHSLAAATTLLS